MTLLFILNITAATLLVFWPLWFSRRILHLSRVNPFTIGLLITLPIDVMKLFGGPLVTLDEGLFDRGYQFALVASNVLVVAQMAGLLFFFRCAGILRIERAVSMRTLLTPRDLQHGAWLFLLVYLLAFWMLASAEFGVVNWLANPREGYQRYRTGQGHWYALAITALSVSLLLSFLSRPTARAILWRTPIYLGLGYLLGSKTVLLSFFTSTLIFLWFIRWPYVVRLLAFTAPVVFALMIWNLFLALSDGFELAAIFEYFDHYKNAADYYRAYLDDQVHLYWGEIASSSFTAYVPRVFWPDKPSVYGVLIINEIFFPGQAELTNTPAFGGAVEQFADFGFAGVVASGLFGSFAILTGVSSYLIFRRPGINLARVTPVTVILLLMQFVPTFGTFFPGLLYVLLLAAVMVLVLLARMRWRGRTGRAPRTLALTATDARTD